MADCSKQDEKLAQIALETARRTGARGVDAVVKELQKRIPSITRDDVVMAVHSHAESAKKPVQRIASAVSELRKEAGQDAKLTKILDELSEHIEAGTLPEKGAPKPDTRSEIVKRLANIRQYLREEINRSDAAVKERLQTQMDKLNKSIAEFGKSEKEFDFRHTDSSPEVKAMQAQVKELQKTLADLRAAASDVPNELLRKQIKEFQDHINNETVPQPKPKVDRRTEITKGLAAARDYVKKLVDKSDPAKKQRLLQKIAEAEKALKEPAPRITQKIKERESPEIEQLEYQLQKRKDEQQQRIEALQPKTFGSVLQNIGGTAKDLLTGFDQGAVIGAQGALHFLALGPRETLRVAGASTRALFSEKEALRIQQAIRERPNAAFAEASGMSPISHKLHLDETFVGGWAQRVPILRRFGSSFEVAVDLIRANLFDHLTRTLPFEGRPTLAEGKILASFANAASFKGKLGDFESAAGKLANVFLTVRGFTSQMQILFARDLYRKGGTEFTRKQIGKFYGRVFSGLGMYYLALMAAGGKIDYRANSTLFGQACFDRGEEGKVCIDPLVGLLGFAKLAAQVGTGEMYTQTGKHLYLYGPNKKYGGPTVKDLLSNFVLFNRLAPIPSTAVNLASHEDRPGHEAPPGQILKEAGTPWTVNDILEEAKVMGAAGGAALAGLIHYGLRTRAILPQPEKPHKLKREPGGDE